MSLRKTWQPFRKSEAVYALRMVEAGMPPMEAIWSATVYSAEMLKASDDIGSITAGKCADIIAVNRDPLQDVNVLRQVGFIMKDGRVIPLE